MCLGLWVVHGSPGWFGLLALRTGLSPLSATYKVEAAVVEGEAGLLPGGGKWARGTGLHCQTQQHRRPQQAELQQVPPSDAGAYQCVSLSPPHSFILPRQASFSQLAKNWLLSYSGNLIGSLAVVALVMATGVLDGAVAPMKTAVAKTSLTWSQVCLGAPAAWACCLQWAGLGCVPGNVLMTA